MSPWYAPKAALLLLVLCWKGDRVRVRVRVCASRDTVVAALRRQREPCMLALYGMLFVDPQ